MNPAFLPETIEDIAAKFSSLMRALTHDGQETRPPDMRDMLIDRLRDALDRRLPQLSTDQPSFLANSFVIEENVHRHSRIEVYRLRHRDLQTLHAMKTVSASHRDDAVARALLLREAGIGLRLRHPNLVDVQMALRLPDGRPAVIMEWAGETLAQRLSGSPLSITDVVNAISGMLRGLHAIHNAGYVHCDVSPGNLLLPERDFRRMKIIDYGVTLGSKERHRDLGIDTAVSPHFVAPEQSRGEHPDARSDVYSAGRVMTALIDACSASPSALAKLKILARQLTRSDARERPQTAIAALDLLGRLQE